MSLGLLVRSERRSAAKKGKYSHIAHEPYSADQLAEIDAQYAREAPRGAEKRYWEDVEEGEELAAGRAADALRSGRTAVSPSHVPFLTSFASLMAAIIAATSRLPVSR